MTRVAIAHACAGLVLLFLIVLPHRAYGYRPFISTDAVVADVNEMEIELGYFNWEREKGNTTFISPKAVLNYGFIHNFELVGEFAVEEPGHGLVRLETQRCRLKQLLRKASFRRKTVSALPSRPDNSCRQQTKTKNALALKAYGY